MIAMPKPQNVSIYFDKVEALKDFHEAEDFLGQVPAYLLDDKEFANICVTISDRLRHDVDLSVMAINRNFCFGSAIFDDVDFVFDSMPEDMRTNKDLNIKLIEADYWRPSLDFLFNSFAQDKDVAISLLKHNDADNLKVLFNSLDINEILTVLKYNPSLFAWITDENLSLNKDFILECLKSNGEVISYLDANELYDKFGSKDEDFGELLAKTALLSANGHGFRIMDGILNVFSLAVISDELWDLAVNRSILCLSFDNCEENKPPEKFFNNQTLIN